MQTTEETTGKQIDIEEALDRVAREFTELMLDSRVVDNPEYDATCRRLRRAAASMKRMPSLDVYDGQEPTLPWLAAFVEQAPPGRNLEDALKLLHSYLMMRVHDSLSTLHWMRERRQEMAEGAWEKDHFRGMVYNVDYILRP